MRTHKNSSLPQNGLSGNMAEKLLLVAAAFMMLLPLQIAAQDLKGLDFAGTLNYTLEQLDEVENGKIQWNTAGSLETGYIHPAGNYGSMEYILAGNVLNCRFDGFQGGLDAAYIKYLFANGSHEFSVDFGRSNFTDPTGLLLNQSLDGIRFDVALPMLSFYIEGGYLGFQERYSSTIFLSQAESMESGYFASSRVITGGGMEFLKIPGVSTLGMLAIGNIDTRSGDRFDSWLSAIYADIPVAGLFIISPVTAVSFSFGDDRYSAPGILFHLKGHFTPPDPITPELSMIVDYASAENDTLGRFIAPSMLPLGIWFDGNLQDVIHLAMEATWMPLIQSDRLQLRNLTIDVSARIFWNAGEETVVRTLTTESGALYGSELCTGISLNPISDLSSQANIGVFIPGDGSSVKLFANWEVELQF